MTQTLNLETEVKPSMEFEGGIMTADSLVEFWPKICEQLDRIPLFWETHWTKESLHEAVMAGRYQVWGFGRPGSINVIVFTEVVDYPANRILRIPLIFGNSLEPDVADYGSHNNRTGMHKKQGVLTAKQ